MALTRIGVMTSGGDAPGMNSAIRAVVRTAASIDVETTGIVGGYDGLVNGVMRRVDVRDVGDILHRGGTILHTARNAEMRTVKGRRTALRNLNGAGIDALVVIGGDGSLSGAHALAAEGVRVVGIPASIDNDIAGTAMALGTDTALNTICETVDKLRDTAWSHQRAFLVETMGRECGYLAIQAGLACGAEVAIVPEVDMTLDEVGAVIEAAYARGKTHAFILVAEGAKLAIQDVAAHLEANDIGFEPRITILGHVQRGGSPTAFDRLLASRFGVVAVEALAGGQTDVMTGLTGQEVTLVPLGDVVTTGRKPSMLAYEVMRRLAR